MLMPMVWTNDFDDLMNGFGDWYDPFDEVVSLVAPDKDEVETEKSIDRHDRKLANRYNKMLRHEWNDMMSKNLMKTDVIDKGDHFILTADLPGFDKKDIHVGLNKGILTVTASHSENKDEKDKETGKFIRRERNEASCARSFEVGEDVKPEEISAKYENGVLTLTVPNKNPKVLKNEETKQIEIK